jgi:hypothetical protein
MFKKYSRIEGPFAGYRLLEFIAKLPLLSDRRVLRDYQ